MELKYVGGNIWGEKRYEYKVTDNCIVYCTFQKNTEEAFIRFIVGLPGGNSSMTEEEAEKYRLGIEGEIGAMTGKHPDIIFINFYKKDAHFGDFYTEEGKLIKKMVIHNQKNYKFDDCAYYEVSSNAKKVGAESIETFIAKDENHMYAISSELITEKEKYEKMFSEIFETLRQPKK